MVAFISRVLTRRVAVAAIVLVLTGSAAFVEAQRRGLWWPDYGGTADNSHFFDSDEITRDNVNRLEMAWNFPSTGAGNFSPIVVDDVMYVYGRNSVAALNATTGQPIWVHDGLQGISSRGVNYWQSRDGREKRLLFQMQHTLQAIDAATGKSILTFGDSGFVDLRANLRRQHQDIYRIQTQNPGRIFQDLLILGSVTGEGYMSPPGDVRAFDVRTGRVVWQFHTVPHPGEFGYETWPRDAWQYVGGVNNWGDMSLDEERGIVYVPLGSGTYDFYGADRHGTNLFANSLVALDARTGRRLWHQQLVHHDLWDYDLVSAPQLITVRRDGRNIDAVAQATKHGYLYVFDRVTGVPVFPIDEVAVPSSNVAGEQASPTQPIPRLPPFARTKFTVDDINPYLPEDERARWTKIVADSANKGLFTPPELRDTVQMPGNRGGSNWGTTSSNPSRGFVYVMSIDAPAILRLDVNLPGGGGGGRGNANPGQTFYQQTCQACHGPDREGSGTIPSLNGVVDRVGVEVVTDVIRSGRGQMPGFGMADAEMAALIGYLANPNAAGGGRGRGAGPGGRAGGAGPDPTPLGPIVGSAGAPAAQEFVKTMPQGIPAEFGAHGGPVYPAGLATPMIRYYTGWNVMRSIVSPPWSTLTAYDLNRGVIKWQVPIGEDPELLARGIRNTGLQQEQRAPLVTANGLLFTANSDGYLRALDEETGQELWKGRLPGNAGGIPAMYEVGGRTYIVVNASGGGQQAGETAGQQPGYVAFALPRANR